MSHLCRLHPYQYIHVADTRSGETHTLLGPLVYTLDSHHRLLHTAPQPCVVVPPNHYVEVQFPVRPCVASEEASCLSGWTGGDYALVTHDTPDLQHARRFTRAEESLAYRLHTLDPFPLFPGELVSAPQPLMLLAAHEAVLVEASGDGTIPDHTGRLVARRRGDTTLFKGPGYYTPHIREVVHRKVAATSICRNESLSLRATEAFTDPVTGVVRVAGEEWTVRDAGLFFPPPQVIIYAHHRPVVLTDFAALVVRAVADNQDPPVTAVHRRKGEVQLITSESCGVFTPTHREAVLKWVSRTIIGPQKYCVVRNPYSEATGSCRWGMRELRIGPCSFFLHPGETLEGGGARNAMVLSSVEALLVEAIETFTDCDGVSHDVSSRWLIHGPRSYIPELPVRVLERRRIIIFRKGEGVYVRHRRSGEVRRVHDRPFMLSEDEELWAKPTSAYIRRLLRAPRLSVRTEEDPGIYTMWERLNHSVTPTAEKVPDPHTTTACSATCSLSTLHDRAERRGSASSASVHLHQRIRPYAVLAVNVEHNALIRLYDSSRGTSRVVVGPAAVYLEPYEEFTPMVLSGGRPKTPEQIHALSLYLGPDYMADVIEVETLDHTRLKLSLSYNWEFDTSDMERIKDVAFTIPDFVGEACKTLASRVRVVIASTSFEQFHRHSSLLIKQAVFSTKADSQTEVRGEALYFRANALLITNVDIQNVEPVELKTRVALTKSVQLAVEISTRSQESEATHNAALIEEAAQGRLDLQVMQDQASAEAQRVRLLTVMAENAVVEQVGASVAQATAECEARLVEVRSELMATPLRCAAHEHTVDAELTVLRQRMEVELPHRVAMNELEVAKASALADIAAAKYEAILSALGQETVTAVARAGPELQAKLLQALGLKGFLMTDGTLPINLHNVAAKLTAVPPPPQGVVGSPP